MKNTQVKLIPKEIREAPFPIARFLSEEEQARYEDSIKQFTGKAYDSLNISKYKSNLFKVLWLNQIGIPTATLFQLEQVIENDEDFLRGHYEDTPSIFLRSNKNSYPPNEYLAKSLTEVIKERDFKHPLILNGLKLKADENSAYGLILVPGEKFERIEAPDFDYKNHRKDFSRINPDYTIEWNEQANRTFYSMNNNLSRIFVNSNLGLYSGGGHIASSLGDDRVVVVRTGEASSQNFEEYIIKIQKERKRQIAEIDLKFEKAMSVLKDN